MKIESEADLRGMKRIGEICGLTLKLMLDSAEAGMSTRDLDDIGRDFMKEMGAASAPIQAYEFPGYTCISLNDEAAHGIPRKDRFIQEGDLLNVDVSAVLEGYWGDTGATIIVPPARPEWVTLCRVTRNALRLAIEMARPGQRANRIGRAVEKFAKRHGYRTLRELGGHGVGRNIHEKPSIPNFNNRRNRDVLRDGMVLTLEPFLNAGRGRVKQAEDGWTLRTVDGSATAQYEHTVIINGDEPILVTKVDGGYV
ncbi:MAG: type I methionyl aminopeptidase [Chloroflexota bacterium]|nr:type I methionyl aminopeptidase [Chloroflexota bacterium]MDE2946513.1 type I methionyl aminopeptidase [Chloroflexota bacterium]